MQSKKDLTRMVADKELTFKLFQNPEARQLSSLYTCRSFKKGTFCVILLKHPHKIKSRSEKQQRQTF